MRRIFILLILSGLISCNEPYNFNIKNKRKGIVVEALVSNRSFMESLQIPSDGRYFSVILRETSDVDNVRDAKISNAKITLKNMAGDSWRYTEVPMKPGTYELQNDFFRVESGEAYQMEITLNTGEKFQSTWEKMPESVNRFGDLHLKETSRQEYSFSTGERRIVETEGIDLSIDIDKNDSGDSRFFLWEYEPFFTYKAGLLPSDSPNKNCWVSSDEFFTEREVLEDKTGGYQKKLLYMVTKTNQKLYGYFSIVIHQYAISESYFNYWQDLKAQKERGGLFDQPPFNMTSNITAVNNDWSTNGYFAVTSEEFSRWEFDKSQLSYPLIDDIEYFCRLYIFDADPEGLDVCLDCRAFPNGKALNYPPEWWKAKYGNRP